MLDLTSLYSSLWDCITYQVNNNEEQILGLILDEFYTINLEKFIDILYFTVKYIYLCSENNSNLFQHCNNFLHLCRIMFIHE